MSGKSENNFRIIFMGTPEFAVESLNLIITNNFNVVSVVTIPDKPAGRGQKIHQSDVKKYCLDRGLDVMQPDKLKEETFINSVKNLKPDLIVVVAFRKLPEEIWSIPTYGTINLHASLLPDYRGAAPINWAVINGEKKTGVTTFFINKDIDAGSIIYSESLKIEDKDNAGIVHDKLKILGSNLLIKTINSIISGNFPNIDQTTFLSDSNEMHKAPKITKEHCRIDWSKTVDEIYNLIRGMSPYPGCYTEFINAESEKVAIKIYESDKERIFHEIKQGTILSDGKKYLKVAAKDGFIFVKKLQFPGKNKMKTEDFLRGCKIFNNSLYSFF